MLKAIRRRISPVHLTPIDAFFLADDHDDYPMTFASNLFFEGEFDRASFASALDEALDLHPLLQAVVRNAKQDSPCFVTATEVEPVVNWGGLHDDVDLESRESIDLRHETGLRIWIRQGEGRSQLTIQFHHACCDGTGAHRFIGDLLAAYGKRQTPPGERSPQTASYDPGLLRKRRAKLAGVFANGSLLANLRVAWRMSTEVFGRRVAPLNVNGKHNNSMSVGQCGRRTFPAIVTHKFTKEQHKDLRQSASKLGVTLNDLILAETFSTMRDWNVQHGSPPDQRLRIMMPSDIRDKDDYALSASNMTSYNFITRRMSECVDERSLLRGLWEETSRIKHNASGRNFVEAIMMASKCTPWLVPRVLARDVCLSTVTVSHMGDPTKRFLATFPRRNGKLVCGNLVLEDMVGVSPMRRKTRASISIVSMYRKLGINVRCDPNTMTLGDAHEFLQMLVRRMSDRLPSGEVPELDTAVVTA